MHANIFTVKYLNNIEIYKTKSEISLLFLAYVIYVFKALPFCTSMHLYNV